MPPTPIVAVSQRIIVPSGQDKIVVVGHVPGPTGPQGPAGPAGPIGNLTDVDPTPPGDGDALFYNLATQLWEPVPAATQAELDALSAAMAQGFSDVDTALDGKLSTLGGVVSGNLTVTGNHTVSGELNLTATKTIQWGNADTLTYDDGANRYTFSGDGTTILRVQHIEVGTGTRPSLTGPSGVLRVTTNSGYVNVGPANSGFCHFTTDRPDFYFDHPIHVNSGNISSYGDRLFLQDRGVTKVVIENGGVSYFGANTNFADGHGGNGWISKCQNSNVGRAGEFASLSLWTQYSTDRHVNLLLHRPAGDYLYVRNWENTAWIQAAASAWNIGSSQVNKERIRTARDEGGLLDYAVPGNRKTAFKQIRKLRPVLFDDLVQHKEKKLNEEGGIEEEWYHHCDDEDCGGTNERPCDLISRHVNRVGLVVEELAEVYPRATSFDQDGKAIAWDPAVMVVEQANLIQHLLEDRDDSRKREARNTLKLRSLERRLAELEKARPNA